jgi:vacuolar-type H+-ATPase subunit I/STV1
VHEYKLLMKVADKRFSNIGALNYLSNEKSTQSRKNLKTIKQDIREMEDMRKTYRKTLNDKQREYKKEIYVGEEYVSHNGMKKEEA